MRTISVYAANREIVNGKPVTSRGELILEGRVANHVKAKGVLRTLLSAAIVDLGGEDSAGHDAAPVNPDGYIEGEE